MKNRLYIIICTLLLSLLSITYGCGSKEATTDHDSTYSVEYINTISISDPEKALAILDTAEQRGLMSKFDISRLRCLSYYNGPSDFRKALQYGLEAYQMPESRNDAEGFLNLMELIADAYYENGDYTQSVKFCTEGLKFAKDSLLRRSEANLNVTLGNNLFAFGQTDNAFRHFNDALVVLDSESKKSDTYMATDDYIYGLGMIINSLSDKRRYDEALAFIPRYEDAIIRLESKGLVPDGLADMRKASGYAAFSYMLALNGEAEKARDMYHKLCATDYSKVPEDRGSLHVPYLLATNRYGEALSYLQEEKEYWQATADTVSYEFIDYHLLREQEAYEGLGNMRAANNVSKTIQQLSDTLRRRDSQSKALELAEIYKTNEQALQIERQTASIIMRNIIIVASVIILVICILFIIRILRYNRTISTKNRAMVKTIDELMTYTDKMFEQQEEMIGLRKRIMELSEVNALSSKHTTPEVQTGNIDQNASESASNDFDRMLFDRMNHEILRRKLFLNPDFSKNTLLAEFRIPGYKFSSFFKEYAGCTFSQYIHNCRLDYAVKLIQENPSWSLEAIAKAAQMSSSSFYNQFKKKFGMSPSDFRAAENSRISDDE